jgi:hypothetical protein
LQSSECQDIKEKEEGIGGKDVNVKNKKEEMEEDGKNKRMKRRKGGRGKGLEEGRDQGEERTGERKIE